MKLRGWQQLAGGSARRAVASIGVAIVLLLIGSSLVAAWVLHERQLEDWKRQLSNLSLVLAENTSQSLSSAQMVLDSLADMVQAVEAEDEHQLIAAMRRESVHQTMRDKISGLPQVDVATIVGADGRVINFTRAWPAPAITLADRDYFAYHRNNADPSVHFSAPVRNKGNGKWTFYISRRLNTPDGQFLGAVLVGLSTDFFAGFFRNASLGEHCTISLLRSDLTLMARSPLVKDVIGQKIDNGTTADLLRSGREEGVILKHGPMLDNSADVLRMGGVHKVRDFPLIVNVTVTEDLFLAGWYSIARMLGGIAAAGVVALMASLALVALMLKRREVDAQRALELKQQADDASAAKSRFLAMMSHEIRTPMNGIVGMSELMLETPLNTEQRSYANNVHAGVQDLMRIINEILDFSKVEAGQMTISPTCFAPQPLVQEVATLHQASAQKKGLRIEVRIAEGTPQWVWGDGMRIRQVLGNLVNNAVKFTPAGHVCVTFSVMPGKEPGDMTLRFEVRDTGIGIAPEAMRRLFEPFMQADESISRRYGGTGLGLGICKRLVELMGGSIDCRSETGVGSTFWFVLPSRSCTPSAETLAAASPLAALPPPPAAAPAQPPAAAQPEPALEPAATEEAPAAEAPRPLQVLVAEDTEMNRTLVRILLTRMGCEVDDAVNGQEAVDALARKRYDLVLMDCMMPVMDGYEATRILRRREAEAGSPPVPVIALTASAIAGDRERCREAGMDDYMSKPFQVGEFTEIVQRYLKRAG